MRGFRTLPVKSVSLSATAVASYKPPTTTHPIHPNVKASVVVTYAGKHLWPADLTIFKHLCQAEAAQLNCGSEKKKLSSDSSFSLLATNLSCVLGCSLRTFSGSTHFMNTFGPDHSHRCCQATTFPKTWTVAQTCNPKKQKQKQKATKTQGSLTLAHLPPRLPSKVNDCQEAEVHSAIQGA